MKPTILAGIALLTGILVNVTAFADKGCEDPVANWQSREVLRQRLEQRGWKVQRIKVDDGCYEVKGIDGRGNKFKAKYAPATLRVRKLEVDFSEGDDGDGQASDYLDKDQ